MKTEVKSVMLSSFCASQSDSEAIVARDVESEPKKRYRWHGFCCRNLLKAFYDPSDFVWGWHHRGSD